MYLALPEIISFIKKDSWYFANDWSQQDVWGYFCHQVKTLC